MEEGESLVWRGHPRTRSVLSAVPGALRLLVVALVGPPILAAAGVDLGVAWLVVIAGLGVLVAVARLGWAYLAVKRTDYALTTDNVFIRRGVLSETVERVGVGRIQSTTLTKDFFGNMFDYGTVEISTAGGSGVELRITDLDDPETFEEQLRERIEAGGVVTGSTDAAGGYDGEELRRAADEARQLREVTARIEEVLA